MIDVTSIAYATFTASDLYTALNTTDDYAHLFYKLTFNKSIYADPGITYKLKLTASGYSFDPSSFIGWVHMHDDPINDYSYAALVDNRLPLTFEIYEKRFNP